MVDSLYAIGKRIDGLVSREENVKYESFLRYYGFNPDMIIRGGGGLYADERTYDRLLALYDRLSLPDRDKAMIDKLVDEINENERVVTNLLAEAQQDPIRFTQRYRRQNDYNYLNAVLRPALENSAANPEVVTFFRSLIEVGDRESLRLAGNLIRSLSQSGAKGKIAVGRTLNALGNPVFIPSGVIIDEPYAQVFVSNARLYMCIC